MVDWVGFSIFHYDAISRLFSPIKGIIRCSIQWGILLYAWMGVEAVYRFRFASIFGVLGTFGFMRMASCFFHRTTIRVRTLYSLSYTCHSSWKSLIGVLRMPLDGCGGFALIPSRSFGGKTWYVGTIHGRTVVCLSQ